MRGLTPFNCWQILTVQPFRTSSECNAEDALKGWTTCEEEATFRFFHGGHGQSPGWLLTEGIVWLDTPPRLG